ncbi:hypothetical protein KTJ16_10625 [Acinetobacter bereziniae]|uniref:hypothetical protein n=1 Tax=Acinetobacter TaxID=469 RepID=UPI0002AEAF3B|nr:MULTISPECIES: hypothetical protein [Acinetobacter]ELW80027.1 hypothetical protein ACINWC743_0507 [Acinetobacter sp. WC-743]KKW81820.1 hypothetical protein AAV97_00885 [Acinetobacter sp. Ag2]MBJ8424428.1 hypothetical protein [Acinetobacter bereziniae]MBJ8428746.1 hypothetical protein [Acinetobacter bereziniae]MBJ8477742.1 hypothetical protein [Acinetobacter bereziniae]
MEKEIYILLGATITALFGYIVARYTSGIQLKIAQKNSEKDIQLQLDRLANERLKDEVSLEREKLEILHKILSIISFENSQTMSYIKLPETELTDFRKRYIENCNRLHDAHAITDLYYPEMSDSIRKIFGQANCFWGYQESVMQIDIKANNQGWHENLSKVLEAGKEINQHVQNLQYRIAERGRELNKALKLVNF